MNNLKLYAMLFFGMALFGSATPISKLVVEHFPVFIGGGMRVFLAFLLLIPFVNFSKIKKFKGKDLWLLIGIGVIGVVGFTAFLLYGMRQVSGVTGSVVMSTTPAVTAGLSYLVFRDMFGWRKAVAIALAVAGVLVINLGGSGESGNSETNFLGIAMVFAAVLCEAGYTLMGKALTADFKPVEVAAFSALIGTLAFIPPAIFQINKVNLGEIPSEGWWALAWYGLGTMGLGSVLWYRGIQKVEGSTAAAFMGIMPLSALILSYLLLDEPFKWIHMAGFALVFAGVVLVITAHRRMEKQD